MTQQSPNYFKGKEIGTEMLSDLLKLGELLDC